MRRTTLKILLTVLSLILVGELAFIAYMHLNSAEHPILDVPSTESTAGPATEGTTVPVTEETTEATTEETTEATTEPIPTEERFVLTFVGDCTLGSTKAKASTSGSFIQTIGEDYDYPFANVREYFENDDFTMANLEVVLADSGVAADKTFAFLGPTAYTNILSGSSVEAVTLANNHTLDFGADGYASTKQALEDDNISYVEQNGSMMFTTESGLCIGVYAGAFKIDTADMRSEFAKMRENGAEIIVAAFHWGNEGSYRPTTDQKTYAHAAIDAGADIVYGHHSHVLQKIEEYGDGIIYYSLGNFSFGGNHFPRDMDSAILQQEVIRDVDGTIRLGELTIIPVSISSMEKQNNFQPTPYEEGSEEYERTLTKLDGTFTGADLVVDYSGITGETTASTEAEQPEQTDPPATEAPATEAPAETDPPATEAPATEAPAEDAGQSSGGIEEG